MKKIIQIAGESFSKLPYDDLILSYGSLVSLGWNLVDCGLCSDEVHHIYALTLGDMSKPTIFIEGGIHGLDEWPNDYWVRDFAKEIVAPSSAAHTMGFSALLSRFSFVILPCLNPYGYINRTRWNANEVDINRNFDYNWATFTPEPGWGGKGAAPFDQPESQLVRSIFQTYHPIMFHDCHGWGAHSGIGISQLGSPDNTTYDYMGADLQKTLNLSIDSVQSPVYPDIAPKYIFAMGADLEARPTAACWGSTQTTGNGIPIISSTTEISVTYYPDMYEYQDRYGKSILFAFCLYLMNLLRDRNMILV